MKSSSTFSALAVLLPLALAVGGGCSNEVQPQPPGTSPGGGGAGGGKGGAGGAGGDGGAGGGVLIGTSCDPANAVARDKVDILFVVDDSGSMSHGQELLASQIGQFVGYFTNPRCLDGQGIAVASQPSGPADPCPAGSFRQFAPVNDLHAGVISASLGGHGADVCGSEDDRAHLLNRSSVTGYNGNNFLAWDPDQKLSPVGQTDVTAFSSRLAEIVRATGNSGCGFEATLEAWYRFLIDPNPYESVRNPGAPSALEKVVVEGTDKELLAQRKAFLRPDSAVVIVMLSDENDCSIRDEGQSYVAAQSRMNSNPFHLPPATQECATDPNDACCRSCGQPALPGCSDSCTTNELPQEDDHINLRCFDQKRRFGIDFLWPVERYIDGLSATQIADRDGTIHDNPLFAGGRTPCDVHLAGLVGVPWQDIARRDAAGSPDLSGGLDAEGSARGGLQSAQELSKSGTWDMILGDPAMYVAPSDPLMRESVEPRTGSHPLTNEALAPAGAGYLANSINGHEYTGQSALQYACIFPLSAPRECTADEPNCACKDAQTDDPSCQSSDGSFTTTEYFATGRPGTRALSVLKGIGDQAVVGSLCATHEREPSAHDYGFLPSLRHIAGSVARSLKK